MFWRGNEANIGCACRASGQEANLDKSGFYFLQTPVSHSRILSASIWGIDQHGSLGKYLELPVILERSKVSELAFIRIE